MNVFVILLLTTLLNSTFADDFKTNPGTFKRNKKYYFRHSEFKILHKNNLVVHNNSVLTDQPPSEPSTSTEKFTDSKSVTTSPNENKPNVNFIRTSKSIADKKIIDDLFGSQIPLPGEEHYLTISSQNCSDQQNSTCGDFLDHAPVFEFGTMIKAIILLIIAGLSFVGNVATLFSIISTGRQSTSTVYILLVQLAIADLLVAVFCLMVDALWKISVQWYGGDLLCKWVKFMQMFSLYLSTYVLVLIGFDRLCAIRFPMSRIQAKKYVRCGIVCIWSLSALFSLPQAFIFRVLRGPFIEDFYQCVTFGFYSAAWQEQLYTTLSLVLMFLLPLIVLIATYVTTFITIAGQENMFSERRRSAIEDARHKLLHKAKIRTLMITVVIVLTFVICWTPYYVTMVIFIFLEPDEDLSQGLQTFVFFFGSSTAMINPFIYGAFHLRRRKKPPTKSTTMANNSTSSRVEISMSALNKDLSDKGYSSSN